jgi:hypothetical protein
MRSTTSTGNRSSDRRRGHRSRRQIGRRTLRGPIGAKPGTAAGMLLPVLWLSRSRGRRPAPPERRRQELALGEHEVLDRSAASDNHGRPTARPSTRLTGRIAPTAKSASEPPHLRPPPAKRSSWPCRCPARRVCEIMKTLARRDAPMPWISARFDTFRVVQRRREGRRNQRSRRNQCSRHKRRTPGNACTERIRGWPRTPGFRRPGR